MSGKNIVKGIWNNTSLVPQKVTYKQPGVQYGVEAEGQTGKPFDEQIIERNQSFEFTAESGSIDIKNMGDGSDAPAPGPATDGAIL